MTVLEVNNIHKRFGKTDVLKGIDFKIEEGEVVSVIGSSGSGKTTLLRCITGLESADEGRISVGGRVTFDSERKEKLSREEKRENQLCTGLVFQSFNLFPQYTVLRNVTLAKELLVKEECKKNNLSREDKKNKLAAISTEAIKIIESVGLRDKTENYPCELSGGQQQRVAIARALVSKPAIVLADEPTGNLDSKTSADVLGLLKTTSQKFHQTLVMITHNNEIAQLADRIIRIEDGKIVQ